MITATTGAVKVQVMPSMKGLPFGLKFFDDDHNIYVSQKVFDEVVSGKGSLRYVVMAHRKSQIPMEDIVDSLIEEIIKYGKETNQI